MTTTSAFYEMCHRVFLAISGGATDEFLRRYDWREIYAWMERRYDGRGFTCDLVNARPH